MATHTNSNQKSFIDIYEDLTKDIQVKLLEYVKGLSQQAVPNAVAGQSKSPTPAPNGRTQYTLETEEGFPKVPVIIDNDKLTKSCVEGLLRQYLTAHYSK